MKKSSKEEKVVFESDRLLSDNQYKIVLGIFGIGLAYGLVYGAIYIINTLVFK